MILEKELKLSKKKIHVYLTRSQYEATHNNDCDMMFSGYTKNNNTGKYYCRIWDNYIFDSSDKMPYLYEMTNLSDYTPLPKSKCKSIKLNFDSMKEFYDFLMNFAFLNL